jgi:hypothetical protein
MKKFPRIVAVAAAAVFFAISPAVAANAATPVSNPNGSYCAMQLQPADSPQPESSPLCFDTDTQLQTYLTSVGVQGADTTTSSVKARSLTVEATTSGSAVLLGEVFQDVYYGGAKMALWGQDGCQNGGVYGWPTLPAGWSNSISSGHGNDTCYLQMYPLQNYMDDGMKITCSWECITMSTMNDRAQSIKFTPYGVFG